MGSVFSVWSDGLKMRIARRLGVSTSIVAMETIESGVWDFQEEVAATHYTLEQARLSFPSAECQSYLYLHARHYKRVRKMLYLEGKKQAGVLFGEAEKLKRKSLFTTLSESARKLERAMTKYDNHVAKRMTFEGPQ